MENQVNSPEINQVTGEVVGDSSSIEEKVGFRSMWFNPFGIETQDLSNPMVETFEEIPPYAVDPKNGKFLNDSSVPKIVSKGKINIQERIQSFAKETDLYYILEKFAYSGDNAIINARECAYADLSQLPNDLNGFAQYTKRQYDKLKGMNEELAKMIASEDFTAEQIEAKAKEIFNSRVADIDKKDGKGEDK